MKPNRRPAAKMINGVNMSSKVTIIKLSDVGEFVDGFKDHICFPIGRGVG